MALAKHEVVCPHCKGIINKNEHSYYTNKHNSYVKRSKHYCERCMLVVAEKKLEAYMRKNGMLYAAYSEKDVIAYAGAMGYMLHKK